MKREIQIRNRGTLRQRQRVELCLLVPPLPVRHVLDLRLRVFRLLALRPRMLQTAELRPQVLGLVVLYVRRRWRRMLPMLVRSPTVLRLLVLRSRMLRAMGLRSQVLGLVVLYARRLWLRVFPLPGCGRFGGWCLR